MNRALIQPAAPVVVTPRGFVKVTNFRKGEVLLPCAPGVLPPGVSYHDEKLFDAMVPAIAESLAAHVRDGELKFEAAQTAPPPPAPVPFVPAPVVDNAPVTVPVLSTDPMTAAKQIAEETNQSILSSWFDAGQSPEISDLLLARHTQLNPA